MVEPTLVEPKYSHHSKICLQFLHFCANMLVKRKSIKILYECPFEIMAIGRKGFAGHALPALKRTIVEYLKKNAECSTKYSY